MQAAAAALNFLHPVGRRRKRVGRVQRGRGTAALQTLPGGGAGNPRRARRREKRREGEAPPPPPRTPLSAQAACRRPLAAEQDVARPSGSAARQAPLAPRLSRAGKRGSSRSLSPPSATRPTGPGRASLERLKEKTRSGGGSTSASSPGRPRCSSARLSLSPSQAARAQQRGRALLPSAPPAPPPLPQPGQPAPSLSRPGSAPARPPPSPLVTLAELLVRACRGRRLPLGLGGRRCCLPSPAACARRGCRVPGPPRASGGTVLLSCDEGEVGGRDKIWRATFLRDATTPPSPFLGWVQNGAETSSRRGRKKQRVPQHLKGEHLRWGRSSPEALLTCSDAP